jgi:hypothetical protein
MQKFKHLDMIDLTEKYKNMSDNEKSSLITKLDYEMTKEVLKGFKPYIGDKFQGHRDIILKLRKELFPNSVWALGTKQS